MAFATLALDEAIGLFITTCSKAKEVASCAPRDGGNLRRRASKLPAELQPGSLLLSAPQS